MRPALRCRTLPDPALPDPALPDPALPDPVLPDPAHLPCPAWPYPARLSAAVLALALLHLTACGVAGHPRPPGPVPPGPPTLSATLSTPDALHITLTPPTTDLDGHPLTDPLTLQAHPATHCNGPPLARTETSTLTLPLSPLNLTTPTPLRFIALRTAHPHHPGPPSPPYTVHWTPPPPPPEAPLAFVDATGHVQLSWLPPPPPITTLTLHRDGAPLHNTPADAALYTDIAPPGPHTYTLTGHGPGFRTAPSPPATVTVP